MNRSTLTRRSAGLFQFVHRIAEPGRWLWAAAVVALLAVGSSLVRAEDNWPTWRGPLANGLAPSAKPPLKWDEKTNIRWKVNIPGRGSASPVVWGDKVFIQTAIPADGTHAPAASEKHQFVLMCLDRQTGRLVWQRVVREETPHEGYHPSDGTFASGSALTDGEHVWAYFGSRGLYCYDMDGNPVWNKDLGEMKIFGGFGEGSSPAIHGDMIVINWDHEGDSFITALNKKTGETIWKTPRPEKTSWSTPLIVDFQGKQQIITTATGKIRTYDLASGKLLWECGGLTKNVIPTPVYADGVAYCTSGYSGNSLLAIKLGGTGDITGTSSILWRYGRNTPYVPSPVLVNDRLYVFASNNPVLTSFDIATGKPVIDAKRVAGPNSVYASPVAADGRIYIVGRNGTTAVIKQADTLEILAVNRLDDHVDASPAMVGSEIFIRGLEHVYCIAEK